MIEIQCQNCNSVWESELTAGETSLMSLLECPICVRVVDDEEPVVEPIKVPVKPKKKYTPMPGRKGVGHPKKYTDEVIEYIEEHYPTTKRKDLVVQLNKKFKLDLTNDKLAGVISMHGLKKRKKNNKSPSLDPDEAFKGEKDLQKLPPPDY